MALETANVKPVTPDQPRQEMPRQQGRPKPGSKGPKGPVDLEKAPVTENARREELAIVEPDLGGRVHAVV